MTQSQPAQRSLALPILAIGIVALLLLPFLMMGGSSSNPVVIIETSAGPIKVELYPGKAPITVKSFLKHVDGKHYDDSIFHRVIEDFKIHGGGFDIAICDKPAKFPPINKESGNGLPNSRGAIAMARTDPNGASAQWYVNVKDNDFLDQGEARDEVGYVVFGRVIDGMKLMDAVRRPPSKNDPVLILSIHRQ